MLRKLSDAELMLQKTEIFSTHLLFYFGQFKGLLCDIKRVVAVRYWHPVMYNIPRNMTKQDICCSWLPKASPRAIPSNNVWKVRASFTQKFKIPKLPDAKIE